MNKFLLSLLIIMITIACKNSENIESVDKVNDTEIIREKSSNSKEERKDNPVISEPIIEVSTTTQSDKIKSDKPSDKTISSSGIEKVATTEAIIDEVVTDIDHSIWNALLQKNVSTNGNVNYKGFIADKSKLLEYIDVLAKQIPDNKWSKNAKLAYWINVYNALTVKLIIDNYPLKSIMDLNKPWETKFFSLAGTKYSLEQVENEILRKMNEPRIHFAINCASYSCPNLLNQAYQTNKLENQLEKTTKSFINDKSKNNISTDEVKVSEIFNWFAADFKTKENSIIDYLNKYSTIKIDDQATVKFLNYNWSLNE